MAAGAKSKGNNKAVAAAVETLEPTDTGNGLPIGMLIVLGLLVLGLGGGAAYYFLIMKH